MKNVIQFRNGFINVPNSNENNLSLAMSVTSELMQFGYMLNKDSLDALSKASKEDIVKFYNEVIPFLKEMTGSNRTYKAFYSGFPEQVMSMSDIELWLHQITHYWSNGSYIPSDWTKARPTAFENSKVTIIELGNEDKFLKIFTDLVSVNSSLTPDDLKIVEWFVSSGTELRFPDVIPFKENLCTLAALKINVPVKTVTDVLRIAVHMSGGDISLPKVPFAMVSTNRWSSRKEANPARESFKFKKFTRAERRFILSLLEKTNCDASEATLKDNRWIRLGEILHPGEYKNQFPKAFKMFDAIRNDKVKSWYGKVEKAFAVSFKDGIKVLSERPGEFMRKVDALIRKNPNQVDVILEALKDISPKVSNKVLYEIYTHFEKRMKTSTGRSIMVKGSRKVTQLPDLAPIKSNIIDNIQKTVINGLQTKFASLPELGYTFIDEELKNIPLPANMRSMSSSLKPTVRGIRIPIGNKDTKTIRAFVHWFDERGNQDIDLTATFLGMGKSKSIGWNATQNASEGCYSGDVRHRQGACAEYIDINIKESLKSGFKYVLLDARNYNGGSFESVKDCVFGYMEREFPKANEIFVPSTLANTTRLTNASSTTIVVMIDLETREYIFLDIDNNGIPVASCNFDQIMATVKPFMEAPKFSVYDLLKLHVDVRGKQVTDEFDANTIFRFNDFSESYIETLKYMGV